MPVTESSNGPEDINPPILQMNIVRNHALVVHHTLLWLLVLNLLSCCACYRSAWFPALYFVGGALARRQRRSGYLNRELSVYVAGEGQ